MSLPLPCLMRQTMESKNTLELQCTFSFDTLIEKGHFKRKIINTLFL